MTDSERSMLPLEQALERKAERVQAFEEARAAESRERLRLMGASPCRQSAKARAGGRSIAQPADVDGLALFDNARAPSMF